MALRRGETHIAPIHLLDEKTGEYNISSIQKYLKGNDIKLLKAVQRVQGLMLPKGNPKGIGSIEDLATKDVIFINRQKGSGTRVFLDFMLSKENVESEKITGYDREMTTHMMVASAIQSGTADVGMGIESVANLMGLDFIPIGVEHYDFAVTEAVVGTEIFDNFVDVLKSEELKKKITELGGYVLDGIGELSNV